MNAAARAEDGADGAGGIYVDRLADALAGGVPAMAASFARLRHLDALPPRPAERVCAPPPRGAPHDVDAVLVGGGLSVLLAPLLARAGVRLAVVERARAGAGHREWNASATELQALVAAGLVTSAACDRLVLARYRHGVCRWHGGGSHVVRGVLDCAVDAAALLATARAQAEAAGVLFFDDTVVTAVGAGDYGVRLALVPTASAAAAGGRGPPEGPALPHPPPSPDGRAPPGRPAPPVLTAGIMIDARGAASPHGAADLVCPTVGGVIEGLDEGDAPDLLDPHVGEILATNDHADGGRQHLWECFPGRPGQATIYLFYYAHRATLAPGSLAALYRRFAARLAGYRRGRAVLIRPTFGLIPGWSRLGPAPRSPHPRVLLVGDAAARHSPLTFCGFGAMLRSLAPATAGIVAHVAAPRRRRSVVDDRTIHAATGALAHLLARPIAPPEAANALLDAAFATLAEMGEPTFAALLRDEMSLGSFVTFLRRTGVRRPGVYPQVWRDLGPGVLSRWLGAAVAAAARASSPGPSNRP